MLVTVNVRYKKFRLGRTFFVVPVEEFFSNSMRFNRTGWSRPFLDFITLLRTEALYVNIWENIQILNSNNM